MSVRSEPPASKGMMLVAAYRAERLRQRPILRSSLRESHEARRLERESAARAELVDATNDVSRPSEDIETEAAQPIVSGSVFASYLTVAEASAVEPVTPDQPMAEASDAAFAADLLDNCADSRVADVPPEMAPPHVLAEKPECPAFDPPLAEIGFGPGMLIRLSQIGVRTTRELASAELGELRTALGDVSRLVDVEAWISSAKRRLEDGQGS
jgi:hypothetical protein